MAETAKRNIVHNENVVGQGTQQHQQQPKADDPVEIVQTWLNKIQPAFDNEDIDGIVACFNEQSGYWRDILCIDQTDFNTLRTNEIATHLKKFGVPKVRSLKIVKPGSAAIVPASPELVWAQAFIEFENDIYRGEGMVRLRESVVGQGDWKAFVFFTSLKEIIGHEELGNDRRPIGAEHGTKSDPKINWLDRRRIALEYKDRDPTVLIVGGGQNGLMLAARFRMLGIDALIIEKNGRVGDSWRKRYHSLCLHDPIWADHLPYIPFPSNWPIFSPKDKIANWFEYYAEAMELNIWLNSTIERGAKFDPQTKKWEISVVRNNGESKRVFRPNHFVLASGFSGEPRLPSFPRDEYQGEVYHSSQHQSAAKWAGKKAIVVGCCNSGHDIAADFCENGADITMVQRSWTYVMSSEHGLRELLAGTYEEHGPPLDEADIALTSLPTDLLAEFQTGATAKVTECDKELLAGLTKSGFKLNPYPAGLFLKYFRDGGGYYIDVGASQMIIDGKIKIKQGVEIEKLTKDGVLFADGTELKADVVVLATGYTSQRETIRKIISDEVADGIGPCWGMDSQGEINGCWRHSGVDRFYLQSGNMFQARCYSKHLAHLIQLQELGLVKEPQYPKYKQSAESRF